MKSKIKIEDISKKAPFTVPEGYFEKMESEILSKIDTLDRPILPIKKPNIWKKWSIGVAASVILSVGLYFYNANQKVKINPIAATATTIKTITTLPELSDITNKQMIAYFENHDVDIDELAALDMDPADINDLEILPDVLDANTINQLDIKYLD